uniref:Beta-1,4-galactosyltransferase n=1 Tax=Amphilophus citrinellus TaxID=61819 RepID=A0A3Q0SDL5_AMPCI
MAYCSTSVSCWLPERMVRWAQRTCEFFFCLEVLRACPTGRRTWTHWRDFLVSLNTFLNWSLCLIVSLITSTSLVCKYPPVTNLPPLEVILRGPIHVSFPSRLSLVEVQRKNPLVVRGGRYRPPNCVARHRTAIIIPHRHREHHLKFLLYYLHPFLQRQQLNYGIYVIHQAGNYTFNRAKLMNAGLREAMREEDWDCLFFHDVDLIPEDDRNTYVCDSNPKHAAVAMDKFGYKLPYKMYFGGVSALTPLQYLKMNGFPNNYWGWGGEDDDIGIRVSLAGMYITRPSVKVGRYKMIKHKLDKGNDVNPKRYSRQSTRQTWRLDGMNTVEYEVISREYLPLYTNITVNIGTEAGLHPPRPPPKRKRD